MSVLVLDNFAATDGTLLPAHVGDSGGGWSRRSDSDAAGDMVITSNQCQASPDSKTEHCLTSVIPATADYTVEATILYVNGVGNQFNTIAGRFSTDGQTGYSIYFDSNVVSGGRWHLAKTTAGAASDLGTWDALYNPASQHVAQLVMVGTAISMTSDGVTQIGPVTDSTYTAIGRASIGGFGVTSPADEPKFTQFRLLGTSVTTAPTLYRSISIRRR